MSMMEAELTQSVLSSVAPVVLDLVFSVEGVVGPAVRPTVDVVKLFSMSLTKRPNKLEHLSPVSLSSLV